MTQPNPSVNDADLSFRELRSCAPVRVAVFPFVEVAVADVTSPDDERVRSTRATTGRPNALAIAACEGFTVHEAFGLRAAAVFEAASSRDRR